MGFKAVETVEAAKNKDEIQGSFTPFRMTASNQDDGFKKADGRLRAR
jgi:hypothetical protein